MSSKHVLAWLPITFCTLTSVGFSSSASAEYNAYQQNNYPNNQNIYFQQASLQANFPWSTEVAMPPAILPYVPFDNEENLMIPNTVQNTHYQPQARTWRQPQPQQRANPAFLSQARQQVLQAANRQMGIRYRWGGNTPREGFDCSGFTKYAYKNLNVRIPRTAAEQSRASRTINRHQLTPGDMIFFKTKSKRVGHVGIYLGNNRFIHAASGGGRVMTDDLSKGYWQKRVAKYGAFLG